MSILRPDKRTLSTDLVDFVILAFAVLGFVAFAAIIFSVIACGPFSATVVSGGVPCPSEDASASENPSRCPPCEAGTATTASPPK